MLRPSTPTPAEEPPSTTNAPILVDRVSGEGRYYCPTHPEQCDASDVDLLCNDAETHNYSCPCARCEGHRATECVTLKEEVEFYASYERQQRYQRLVDEAFAEWNESPVDQIDRRAVSGFEQYARRLDPDVDEQARLPALLTREDGETLVYANKLTTIIGEPGCGKSWLALFSAMAAIDRGGRVLWADFEDRPSTLAIRAMRIGRRAAFDPDRFRYVVPDMFLDKDALKSARRWLTAGFENSLVVVDAAESAGCPSDGSDVAPWFKHHVDPWREAGAAVIVLDHVPKHREGRPRGGIGSQHKLARIDGAAIAVGGRPWTKRTGGRLFLQIHKDRPGDLPGSLGSTIAVVIGDYREIDGHWCFSYAIEVPEKQPTRTEVTRQLLGAIANLGTKGVSGKRALRALVKGRGSDVDLAAEELEYKGMVQRVPSGRGWAWVVTPAGLSEVSHEPISEEPF